MGYEAGNLELSIIGFSEKAVTSIDLTAKSLRRLASAVDKINNTQFAFAGQKLELIFEKIAKATRSIDTNNLNNLAVAAKSLSSISRMANLDKMDFDKVGKGFSTLSIAIQPFLDKVREAEASLVALDGILRRSSGKKIQGLLNPTASNSRGGLFGFAKLGINLYMMRRLGRVVGDIAQSGADYTETLNLWETAMGGNLNVATQFVNKMNEAYGISEKTLMNAQAIFKNMLGSLGEISDTMAYSLSEGITQMALDYASLYNQTFEQAFTKFQAALAGQVRPIRSVAGYDITENTLFQLYQALGGTKTMRQLSRTEKQLLSILAIFNQMSASGAIGDLNKTMESFANQSRVMAEAWSRVVTYSGVLATYWIEQTGIMQKVNALLIFIGDALKDYADYLGAIRHFADPFESVTTSANEAADATDNLNGKLLDFDKFRALEDAQSTDLALDEKLLSALANFNSILDSSNMEAQNLAQTFKMMSGIYDENGVFNPDKMEEYLEKLKSVGAVIGEVFIALSALKIAKGIGNIITAVMGLVSSTGLLGKALTFIMAHPIISIIAGVIALMGHLYLTNEGVRESINGLFEALYPIINWVTGNLADELKYIGNILSGTLDVLGGIISVIVDLTTVVLKFINIVLIPFVYAIDALNKAFYTLLEVLGALLTWNWGELGNKLSNLWTDWSAPSKFIPQFEVYETDGGSYATFGSANQTTPTYRAPTSPSASTSQMEQAFFNALSRHSDEGNGTIIVRAYIDGKQVYESTTSEARARGNTWAKV